MAAKLAEHTAAHTEASLREVGAVSEFNDEIEGIRSKFESEIEKLHRLYPSVFHMDFSLSDFTKSIDEQSELDYPSIRNLTILCLFVRAARYRSQLELLCEPQNPERDQQIRALIQAVQKALFYVAHCRGYYRAVKDEEQRRSYEDHIGSHLSDLKGLISS